MANTPCAECGRAATAGVTTKKTHGGQHREARRCVSCAALASVTLPPVKERRAYAPEAIRNSPAWALAAPHSPDGTLWLHQSLGLIALEARKNLAVATATASGKSLIFQTWTVNQLTEDDNARTVVFYPTKALANDQHRRWTEGCQQAGLDPDIVQTISGDTPMAQRDNTLRRARIAIMTPDVCHAWLLRRRSSPVITEFMANLRTVVIDEAHIYEDVFGSNAAYLFRRLTAAAMTSGTQAVPQFIAATATILDPAEHMARLTGQEFTVVADDRNGSPRHTREIVHLPTTFSAGGNEQNLAELVTLIIDTDPEAQLIAFADSRQGIERIARYINRDDVLPYRSGYRPEDRRRIEQRLQDNSLRAVIATSALELGIDMADLNYGINLDLPQSRKQLLQRVGRIGRSKPGTFIILAHEGRFNDHGDSLAQYLSAQVEPSYLYLDNEYVAYQQALCMAAESNGHIAQEGTPPPGCCWPETFTKVLTMTQARPPDHLASIQLRATRQLPHIAYSMRNSGEEILNIVQLDDRGKRSRPIETITVNTAIREAYPGAKYNHQRKAFHVKRWARNKEDGTPFIEVEAAPQANGRTRAILRHTAVTAVPLAPDDNAHTLRRREGLIAHLPATVTESVEGYHDTDGRMMEYKELQLEDPHLSRKEREFPTTGVLIQVRQKWFEGRYGEAWDNRQQIARALKRQLTYRRSIAQGDIGIVTDNLFLNTAAGHKLSANSILVYDNVYGGLALTEDLWKNLRDYAHQLHRAAQGRRERGASSTDRRETRLEHATITAFLKWLEPDNDDTDQEEDTDRPNNWWRIYRPGTQVIAEIPDDHSLVQGAIIQPVWNDGVHYTIRTSAGDVTAVESSISPSGPRPDWMLWQPSSNTTEALDSIIEF